MQPDNIEPKSLSHEHNISLFCGVRMRPLVASVWGCCRLMMDTDHLG